MCEVSAFRVEAAFLCAGFEGRLARVTYTTEPTRGAVAIVKEFIQLLFAALRPIVDLASWAIATRNAV